MQETESIPSQKKIWHLLSREKALARLFSDLENGLNPVEVESIREQSGSNELAESEGRRVGEILWAQVREPMVILLAAAAGISLSLGEAVDAIAIVVIVLLNTILGFVQEFRAEQAMQSLKQMAAPTVRVRRGGKEFDLPSSELVPGDVVLVETGNRVPADCRLMEAHGLEVQEAALTGESATVSKVVEALEDPDCPIGDRVNMIYMGTDITNGRGVAVVAETGMQTELGKIAGMLESRGDKKTPLQRQLARLGIKLAFAAIGIVVIVFLLGWLRGEDLTVMLMTALSMAVAAVPEGLPAIATISLAIGARRLLHRNALIRRLPAVETLGSVTVICSDKTGTLTANRMEVTSLWDGEATLDLGEYLGAANKILSEDDPKFDLLRKRPALGGLLLAEELCNDAKIETSARDTEAMHTQGDPTETALLVASTRFGFDKQAIEVRIPRVSELPFDSFRKRMTTIHETADRRSLSNPISDVVEKLSENSGGKRYLALMKGAVESVLTASTHQLTKEGEAALTAEWKEKMEAVHAEMASQGKRVLALAYRWLDELPNEGESPEEVESGFVFLGLAGMLDPPREEAKAAVERCRSAGIRPVMITGDHAGTAHFIARQLGITEENRKPISGRELEVVSDSELVTIAREASVYARVSPEHKLRIVEALQEDGEVVAMTGDGVNDAPALKRADIGVAMGITGTDVSKDAAETVLLDDDFSTIVDSVEEGRTIYDNIRKFLQYTLTSNTGEIWVMLAAPLLGMPLPLVPLQILWINLLTDGLPGLALAVEPAESNVMKRPPRPPKEPVLTVGLIRHILVVGLLMGTVSLGVGYAYWLKNPTENYDPSWGTIIFTVLTLSQMGNALAIRSNHDSIFTIGFLTSKPMLGAIGLTLLLQLAVIYVPFLQEIFRTVALSWLELLFCLVMSTSIFWVVELEKMWRRRRQPLER